jgi:phosphatidylethanolamine/phosphatidyl-N-methylethanolamine N-methyltransferase
MLSSCNRIFLQSAARDFKRTGAVAPSSRSLAYSMTSELARQYRSPVSILEVGAGTGSITSEIVRHINKKDSLDIYEIDSRFAGHIRRRFREESSFRRGGAKVRIFNRTIELIERRPRYDFVISCLPFTNFEPEAVREIFEIYRAVLKPGGICSFYEYVFLRSAARIMSGNPTERERVAGVAQVVKDYIDQYGYGNHIVLRNLPPAAVHHIRFAVS